MIKSQSLKALCQLIIKKILIVTWKKREIVLLNKKYDAIAQKAMQRLVVLINLFLITDVDKKVKPKDRKE